MQRLCRCAVLELVLVLFGGWSNQSKPSAQLGPKTRRYTDTKPGLSALLALRAPQFGHFQDFFRVNKSLLSAKAERDLGSWPKAPTRTRPGGTYDSSSAIYRRVRDHMGPASRRDARVPPRAQSQRYRSSKPMPCFFRKLTYSSWKLLSR
jgi:hypothetical protein